MPLNEAAKSDRIERESALFRPGRLNESDHGSDVPETYAPNNDRQQPVPQQALSPATASGNQHDQSVLNIDANAKDSFGKVLFILKEFITVYNSSEALKIFTIDLKIVQQILRSIKTPEGVLKLLDPVLINGRVDYWAKKSVTGTQIASCPKCMI
ncbi:hypothetical protein CEXT_649501 [Caerostris extrusa]|uniref:Uncharacterized protein n=1 Tax=Caerostris extrusa TaxID=172846 RepID=A0AAV4WC61_CAEEX|nr:hypothetical protein CEXT_649501 [Caerostris extrusa]